MISLLSPWSDTTAVKGLPGEETLHIYYTEVQVKLFSTLMIRNVIYIFVYIFFFFFGRFWRLL